jgi:hypothetical protein
MSIAELQAVAAALDAELALTLRWRGGDLDRLLDEGHARLVGLVLANLVRLGWEARPEVSYAIFGERGSVDILARHPSTGTLLVIEVKTELVSIEETLRKHDEKVRLGPRIARERFGWHAVEANRMLVLPAASTARRRVDRQANVLTSAYPARGATVRRWLRDPVGRLAGIQFVDLASAGAGPARSRRRVGARRAPTSRLGSAGS